MHPLSIMQCTTVEFKDVNEVNNVDSHDDSCKSSLSKG